MKKLIVLAALVILTSCSGGDSSTGTNPDPDPDPDPDQVVSFSRDIEPIFNGSCSVAGCHNSGTQESGVNLSSHNAALNSVGVQYGTEIIDPGNPGSSPIVDKISNDNPQFGSRMPQNRPPLSTAQIDSVIAWIEDGAPNN